MSTTRLRRSRRAPKKSVNSDYSVGDVVQVTRAGNIVPAKLLQLLTEGTSSPNPRWLIKLMAAPYKDEEVYEHTFGEVITPADDGASSTGNNQAESSIVTKPPPQQLEEELQPPSKKQKNDASSVSSRDADAGKNSILDEDDDKSNLDKPKMAALSNDSSPSASEEDSAAQRAKVSAREQRSRRRQAQIDVRVAKGGNKRKFAKTANGNNKRGRDEENCVKIKFLTGTLYLYRGRHRRAEFIRRI